VRQRFAGITALRLATPAHPALHGFLTAYRLPAHVQPPLWRNVLWEQFRIEAPIVERPEGPLLRVSTHFYNTEEEIDRIGKAAEVIQAQG
jgi:selenocysteine lyase/cysteine desulfurase